MVLLCCFQSGSCFRRVSRLTARASADPPATTARVPKRRASPSKPASSSTRRAAGTVSGSPTKTRHRGSEASCSPASKMVRQGREASAAGTLAGGAKSRVAARFKPCSGFRKPVGRRTVAEATAARLTATQTANKPSSSRPAKRTLNHRSERAAAQAGPPPADHERASASAAAAAEPVPSQRLTTQQARASRRLAAGRPTASRKGVPDSPAPALAKHSVQDHAVHQQRKQGATSAKRTGPTGTAAVHVPRRSSSVSVVSSTASSAVRRPLQRGSGHAARPTAPKPRPRPELAKGKALAAADSPRARNTALLSIVVGAIQEANQHAKVSHAHANRLRGTGCRWSVELTVAVLWCG
jgi:hypothetical protein